MRLEQLYYIVEIADTVKKETVAVLLLASDRRKCFTEQSMVCEHVLNFIAGVAVLQKHFNISSINAVTAAVCQK